MEFPQPTNKKLEVRKSLITNAGEGVFTLEEIKKDECVIEYTGYLIWSNKCEQSQNDVAVNVRAGISLVGTGLAAKINDTVDFNPITDNAYVMKMFFERDHVPRHEDKHLNCEFKIVGEGEFARVFVMATTDISPGEELYIDYGVYYWLHRFKIYKLVDESIVAIAEKKKLDEMKEKVDNKEN